MENNDQDRRRKIRRQYGTQKLFESRALRPVKIRIKINQNIKLTKPTPCDSTGLYICFMFVDQSNEVESLRGIPITGTEKPGKETNVC